MINASEAFASAVAGTSRTFKARFLDRGTEIDAVIRRLVIYKGSCGPSDFMPGSVFSPYIDAALDYSGSALEDKELELQIGVRIGGSLSAPVFDYIRIGFFTVGRPKTSTHMTTFTACGRIQAKLSGKFFFSVVTGMLSVADVAARIEELTGVYIEVDEDLDTTVHLNDTFLVKCLGTGLTCREALSAAAFAVGGYATETNDGKIRICRFRAEATAEYDAADTMIQLPEFHDYDTEITGIRVTVSEEIEYTDGDDINLELDNAYITEEAFNECALNLIGLTYRGGEVILSLGDPRLEPWDTLRIIDTEGESFLLPCMSLIFTYDGGLQTSCEAPSVENNRMISTLNKAMLEAQRAADAAADVQARADAGDFDATVLRIDSSRGVLFKNSVFDTVLTVTIYKGNKIITDKTAMQAEYGAGAYLQWKYRRFEDEDWHQMLVTDSHLSNDGFTLTVTPADVDEKIVFKCDLEI